MAWDELNTTALTTSSFGVGFMIISALLLDRAPAPGVFVAALGLTGSLIGLVTTIVLIEARHVPLNTSIPEGRALTWGLVMVIVTLAVAPIEMLVGLKRMAPTLRAQRSRRALERADWVLKWLHLQGFTLSRYNDKKVTPDEGRAVVARLWGRATPDEVDALMPRQRGGAEELASV